MMQPTLPPPPPFREGASSWEAVILAEVRPAVVKLIQRKVQGLAWADLEVDDAVQRVLAEVILACRRWSTMYGPEKPAERYIWAAVHRARSKLYRSVKRHGKPRTLARPGEPDAAAEGEVVVVLRSDCPGPDAIVEQRSRQRLYVEVTAGLFADMDAADADLMRLSAEGYSPQAIAEQVGRVGDNVAVAQRLYVLRRRAREQLARLGIRTLEDVHTLRETCRPDVHAAPD